MSRKYSVEEIDRMRDCLDTWRLLDGEFPGKVEEMLRTYMVNGTDPQELEVKLGQVKEEHWQRQEERRIEYEYEVKAWTWKLPST